MTDLNVNVLVQCSKKTGKVTKVMTGMGTALMKMWALNHTTKTKMTFIFIRDTGDCVFACRGTEGFPEIATEEQLCKCWELGISLDDLKEMGADDRFDN